MPWRVLFGAISVLLLVGFVVDRADIAADFDFKQALTIVGPLIVVAIGLNQLVRAPGQPWGALVTTGVGLWLLVAVLAHGTVEHLVVVPALIGMMIALRITLPGGAKRDRKTGGQKVPVRFEHEMRDTIVLAGAHFRNDSQRFQGGRVNAVVGDYDIDLRGAMLQPTGAELRVNAVFGSVRIRVPESMTVTVAGTPVFANIDHRARHMLPPDPGRPTLRIQATAVAGTVEIAN